MARPRILLALVAPLVLLLGLAVGVASAAPGSAAPQPIRARLAVAVTTAPVGTEVPFTLTVTLGGKAVSGAPVRLQVRNEQGVWQTIDGFRTNRKGMVTDTVTGYVPGYVGRYRVLVLGTNRALLATSNVVAVTWTAATTGLGGS